LATDPEVRDKQECNSTQIDEVAILTDGELVRFLKKNRDVSETAARALVKQVVGARGFPSGTKCNRYR
jgi:hypothetical protein